MNRYERMAQDMGATANEWKCIEATYLRNVAQSPDKGEAEDVFRKLFDDEVEGQERLFEHYPSGAEIATAIAERHEHVVFCSLLAWEKMNKR